MLLWKNQISESEKPGYLGSTDYGATRLLRCPNGEALMGVLGTEVWRPNREGVPGNGGVSADGSPSAPKNDRRGYGTLLITLYKVG
jgi:hypothetical protein